MPEVETKTIEPMTVMSLSFTGPYSQTGNRLDELVGWVLRGGHPHSGPPMGIYYDDPAKVSEDELRAEVLVPIEEECEGEGLIVRRELPGAEVAYAVHEGSYSKIKKVYEEIFNWITENGYRPVEEVGTREVFHKVYGQVDSAAELLTEVQVPVTRE